VVTSNTYGKMLDDALPEVVMHHLSSQSPRKIKLAIEEGAFKAIRHVRRTIQAEDLPIFKVEEKYHVGFI
jgi:hypothetical protein